MRIGKRGTVSKELATAIRRWISSVTWNEIDLPQTVTFSTGSTINYYYAADGTKLREVRAVVAEGSTTTTTIDWCGDLVLETDDYYPLGGPLPTGTSTALQPEKYQGKEWNPAASFNVYDFGARLYDPALGRWISQDPLAEKYYLHSPYLFCAGNPMKFIDPEGRKIVVRHTNEDNTFTEYEWREQNDVWGFYDADGKLFEGTDSYIQDLNSSLLTLMEGANGSKMIKEIVASINRIVLENNEFNDKLTGNKYFSGSRSIGWSAIKSNSEPFISLGHELAHAMDDLRGTLNTNTWISAGDLYNGYSVPKDIPFSEVFATHYENLIRAEHGIPLRTGYLKSQQGTGMYFGPRIVDRKGQSLFFNSEGQTAYKLVNKNNRYRY